MFILFYHVIDLLLCCSFAGFAAVFLNFMSCLWFCWFAFIFLVCFWFAGFAAVFSESEIMFLVFLLCFWFAGFAAVFAKSEIMFLVFLFRLWFCCWVFGCFFVFFWLAQSIKYIQCVCVGVTWDMACTLHLQHT